jgi:hypothetical protein
MKGEHMRVIRFFISSFICILLLPAGVFAFPTVYPTGTTIYKPGLAYEGYTLYTSPGKNRVLLINMQGQIVHEWVPPAGMSFGYSEPLPNQNILVFAKNTNGGKSYHYLLELDWMSNVVWQYYSPNYLHHDFERLNNGNTLISCADERFVPEISPLPIIDNYIIEVDPQGNILWEWRTSLHYNEFGFSAEAKSLISSIGGDWAHTNSIQSIPDNILNDPRFKKGNILVSQRNTNIIFVIDKSTGSIVWQVGPDSNLTIGQHDVEMIPIGLQGAGNILVFDNGGIAGYPQKARLHSRVVMIDPVSKKIVNEYSALVSGLTSFTFFSPFVSSAQKLPNGNTLINEGNTGRFFEINQYGEVVWEYINPFSNRIYYNKIESREVYRVWRVDLNWPLFNR